MEMVGVKERWWAIAAIDVEGRHGGDVISTIDVEGDGDSAIVAVGIERGGHCSH